MKVFNIGLPKTGTTSFAAFLRSHGLRALHNPIQFRKHLLEGGDCRFDGLGHFDAISNFGEWRWGELAACWPGCKFVVTVRPFEAWIKSAERQAGCKPLTRVHGAVREEIFGTAAFDREKFTSTYWRHWELVESWFERHDQPCLRVDISRPVAAEEICTFLGLDGPRCAMPHENRSL